MQELDIQNLRNIKEKYVDGMRDWYAIRTTWPRLMFRTAGTLVIIGGALLSYLAGNTREHEWLIPIVSLAIVVLTGFNAFFNWQGMWQKRIVIKQELDAGLALWETQIDEAQQMEDKKEAYSLALEATRQLIKSSKALNQGETTEFFSGIKMPSPSGNDRPPSPGRAQ